MCIIVIFVYGDFSKHKTKYIEINLGLKKKNSTHLEAPGKGEGKEKLQIMETSLNDRNYRSEMQVRSVTSANQTKAPYVGHIPSASFSAQDKVLFPSCRALLPNCQHCKAVQLWVKQLWDTLPPTAARKLSAQFFFITGTCGMECQGLRADLCQLLILRYLTP